MDDSEVDRKILSAFRRLYNLDRLKRLEAPLQLVEDAENKVAMSRSDLGEAAWEQVQQNYPRFKERTEERDRLVNEFDERCKDCAYWNDKYFSVIDDTATWCEKYDRLTISAPEPCKDFRLKVIN